jgi:hypothetical protein
MRLHITLDREVVAALDARVGPRGRSRFIAAAVRQALDDARRWDEIDTAIGSIPDEGHEWDADPGQWVHEQRHVDERRVG